MDYFPRDLYETSHAVHSTDKVASVESLQEDFIRHIQFCVEWGILKASQL